MQNLILYHLVSGHAWLSGGLLFLLVIGADMARAFDRRGWLRRGARIFLIVAILLAVLSGTPLSFWLAIPLAIACLAYLCFGLAGEGRKRRLLLGALAGGLALTGLAVELPYHLGQSPPAEQPARLYILADSLTAGEGGKQVTWPKTLAATTGIEVRDLSRSGATVRSVLEKQAPVVEREAGPEAWVFIELGGNDLLGDTSAEEFAEALDRLLTVARGDPGQPRRVVMLELPLLPGQWVFGARQRELAARHGVLLVPKRLLAGLVLTDANVSDGLHLTQTGQDRMAELLLPWLGRP
jgi:acyl-CoA thioesterase-1